MIAIWAVAMVDYCAIPGVSQRSPALRCCKTNWHESFPGMGRQQAAVQVVVVGNIRSRGLD